MAVSARPCTASGTSAAKAQKIALVSHVIARTAALAANLSGVLLSMSPSLTPLQNVLISVSRAWMRVDGSEPCATAHSVAVRAGVACVWNAGACDRRAKRLQRMSNTRL